MSDYIDPKAHKFQGSRFRSARRSGKERLDIYAIHCYVLCNVFESFRWTMVFIKCL